MTVNQNPQQSRINPDSRTMLWVTVFLVFLLGLTSFMVSFNGLHDVAGWVGLPWWMRWTVPIFIDIAILAYSMAAVIHRSRGEPTALTWATLGAFTLISVVANAAHALAVGEGETAVQSWIGAAIAAAAPLSVFAATEELSRLAFGSDDIASSNRPQHQRPEIEEADTEPQIPQDPQPASQPRVLDEQPEEKPLSISPAVELESDASPVPQTPEPTPQVQNKTTEDESSLLMVTSPTDQKEDSPADSQPAEETEAEDEDPDFQILRPWVLSQIAQGKRITGAKAGELIGKSGRTGLNKINALRASEPELFAHEN